MKPKKVPVWRVSGRINWSICVAAPNVGEAEEAVLSMKNKDLLARSDFELVCITPTDEEAD